MWEAELTDLHCLRSEVEIGSRSQEVSGELDKSAETSATVAGWKKDNSGGLEAGGRCGEVVVVPDRIEDRSLFIYLLIDFVFSKSFSYYNNMA